jgi:ABC-type multidrug transport system fused ATPase/permease subunit
MKFFREFIKNYKATYLLKKRYYKITSVVGILSVAAGVAIMVVLAFYVGPMLGFDPNAKIGSSSIEKFALFVAVMSFFIVCLYLGVLIVAGSFAFVMYKTGHFSKSEALNYALYSGYPAHWFEDEP